MQGRQSKPREDLGTVFPAKTAADAERRKEKRSERLGRAGHVLECLEAMVPALVSFPREIGGHWKSLSKGMT